MENGRRGTFIERLNESRRWAASQNRKIVLLVGLHQGKQDLFPANAQLGTKLSLLEKGPMAEDGAILFWTVNPTLCGSVLATGCRFRRPGQFPNDGIPPLTTRDGVSETRMAWLVARTANRRWLVRGWTLGASRIV